MLAGASAQAEKDSCKSESIFTSTSARSIEQPCREKPGKLVVKIKQKARQLPETTEAASPPSAGSKTLLPKSGCRRVLENNPEDLPSQQSGLCSRAAPKKLTRDDQTQPLLQSDMQAYHDPEVVVGKKVPTAGSSRVESAIVAAEDQRKASEAAEQPSRQQRIQNLHAASQKQDFGCPLSIQQAEIAAAPGRTLDSRSPIESPPPPLPLLPAVAKSLAPAKTAAKATAAQQKHAKNAEALSASAPQKKAPVKKKGRLAKLRQMVSTSTKLSSASHFAPSSSAKPAQRESARASKPPAEKSQATEEGGGRPQKELDVASKPTADSRTVTIFRPAREGCKEQQKVADQGAFLEAERTPHIASEASEAIEHKARALLKSSPPAEHQSSDLKQSRKDHQEHSAVRQQAKPKYAADFLGLSKASKSIFNGRGVSMLKAAALHRPPQQKRPHLSGGGLFFELTPRLSSNYPEAACAILPCQQKDEVQQATTLQFQ